MSALPLPAGPPRRRRPTATARFGSSRRESHDASAFYDRFVAPEITTDATIATTAEVDVIHVASATDMAALASSSVALVVTSPPYFAGKAYEESLGVDGVPATYFEYLGLLEAVFAECKRVLEPGGRIAVNVANLGRRPYRSLAGDVTTILGDLGLLLRGEVVWWKGRAAGGSCAWGTFQRPNNPVLRDVTERVVIASKGRFDRALSAAERRERGLPSTATISRDEFMEATTDLWEIPPERATRVGHPAPFPVELPTRFIDLFTYAGDLVLDPFMGSGTTAVAAVRTGRRFVGYDTDPDYVRAALARIDGERAALAAPAARARHRVELPAVVAPSRRRATPAVAAAPAVDGRSAVTAASAVAVTPAVAAASWPGGGDIPGQAVREGRAAKDVAGQLLATCGFVDIRPDVKPRGIGIEITFVATGQDGAEWAFDVSGAFTSTRAGLRRTDTLYQTLGRAAVLQHSDRALPLVLLTTDLPVHGSAGARALAAVTGPGRPVSDVLRILEPGDHARLRALATGASQNEPLAGARRAVPSSRSNGASVGSPALWDETAG